MAKLAKYLLITSGMLLLFYFGGVVENNGTSTLLSLLANPSNIGNTGVLSKVAFGAIVAALGITGIVVLGNYFQRPDLLILGGVALLFFDLILGMLEIYNKIISINPDYTIFAVLLFAPILVLLFMAIIDWWRAYPD